MSRGTHPALTIVSTTVAAHGCEGRLGDGDQLLDAMRGAAATVGAHEHGAARAQYVPHGLTAVVFLAESHVLVSTWPELAFAHIEIAVCGSGACGRDLWAELRSELRPRQEELHELRLSVPAVEVLNPAT